MRLLKKAFGLCLIETLTEILKLFLIGKNLEFVEENPRI